MFKNLNTNHVICKTIPLLHTLAAMTKWCFLYQKAIIAHPTLAPQIAGSLDDLPWYMKSFTRMVWPFPSLFASISEMLDER
jgi:hypothetical protein